jgi:hypothetical protein
MMPYNVHDQMLPNLERLLSLTPDPAHAARVRARCRAQLARRQRRSAHKAPIVGFGRRRFAPVIILSLCALYIASLVGTALRLRGIF